jgi:LysM repeat protein
MIMKMKKILRMPLRRMPRRTPPAESLHAKAAASAETYDKDDYDDEEPSMKFSHALIVVLALHVIAVGGIFAFNSIKAGQNSSTKASTKGENAPLATQATAQSKPSPAQGVIEKRAGKTHTVQAGDTLSRIAALYKIGVEALEKENGITTYSMIKVGQILKIPAPESLAVKPELAKPATDPVTTAAKHAFLAAKTDIAKPAALITKTDVAKPPSPAAKTDVAKPPSPAAKTDVAKPASPAAKTDVAKPPSLVAKSDVAKSPAVAAKTDASKPPPVAVTTPKPANAQPSPKKAETPSPTTDSDVYVVAKGDNPYNIAKKLHVSYNELLAINEIKDPTRVQIGQKLKIPAKKN